MTVRAYNVNGETVSDSTVTFLSLPNTVVNLTGEVITIEKPLPNKGPEPSTEMVPINAVQLYWDPPCCQYATLTETRLCHGRYGYVKGEYKYTTDTIILPPNRYSTKVVNLRPYISHRFSITTKDVFGQESYRTPYLSLEVGGPCALDYDSIPMNPISKSGTAFTRPAVNIWPNPFNPTTSIAYVIPRDGYVKLSTFNILGQRMEILTDEFQTAGEHLVIWKPSPDTPSGIYLIRLFYEGTEQSVKTVLLK